MNKIEKKREEDESTLITTMARVPLRSNFSINAILPEIADRDTPPEGSPAPSGPSDADDASSDGDVNVDYESENEGKHRKSKHTLKIQCFILFNLFNFLWCESCILNEAEKKTVPNFKKM